MLKDMIIDGQVIGRLDVPDGMRVEYKRPKGGEDFIDSTEPESGVKRASFNFAVNHHFVLVPIPPQMVPLGPQDFYPGQTLLRRECWTTNGRGTVVLSVHPERVAFVYAVCGEYEVTKRTYQQLKDEKYLFSNDGGKTFAPCSKPASPA